MALFAAALALVLNCFLPEIGTRDEWKTTFPISSL